MGCSPTCTLVPRKEKWTCVTYDTSVLLRFCDFSLIITNTERRMHLLSFTLLVLMVSQTFMRYFYLWILYNDSFYSYIYYITYLFDVRKMRFFWSCTTAPLTSALAFGYLAYSTISTISTLYFLEEVIIYTHNW